MREVKREEEERLTVNLGFLEIGKQVGFSVQPVSLLLLTTL